MAGLPESVAAGAWSVVRAYFKGALVVDITYQPGANGGGTFAQAITTTPDAIDTLVFEARADNKVFRFVVPVEPGTKPVDPWLNFAVFPERSSGPGYDRAVVRLPVRSDVVPDERQLRLEVILRPGGDVVWIDTLEFRLWSTNPNVDQPNAEARKQRIPLASLGSEMVRPWLNVPESRELTGFHAPFNLGVQGGGAPLLVRSDTGWVGLRWMPSAAGASTTVHALATYRWGSFIGAAADAHAVALLDPPHTGSQEITRQRPGLVLANARVRRVAWGRQRMLLVHMGATGGEPTVYRDLLGAIGMPGYDYPRFWNRDIAEPYLRSVGTLRGGVRASLLPQFLPEDAEDFSLDELRGEFRKDDVRPPMWIGILVDRSTKRLEATWPAVVTEHQLILPGARDTLGRPVRLTAKVAPLGAFAVTSDGKKLELFGPEQYWSTTSLSPVGTPDPQHLTKIDGIVGVAASAVGERSLVAWDMLDPVPAPASIRSGALDIGLGPLHADDRTGGLADRLGGTLRADLAQRGQPAIAAPILVTLSMLLPLDRLRPGGQDAPRGELRADSESALRDVSRDEAGFDERIEKEIGRETSVVIPLKEEPVRRLAWRVVEATRERGGHSVDQEIMALGATGKGGSALGAPPQLSPGRAVVLDRNPFLVALVSFPALQPRDAARSSTFAVWDDDQSTWRIEADPKGEFSLVLPPQAVGEAMEKDGNLLPVAKAPIGYRFGEPTRLRLRASVLERRYVTAPWNLRVILGVAGDETPGAFVEEVQYELLYGLSCRVEKPHVRLAEITARVGALPRRVPRDHVKTVMEFARDAGCPSPQTPVHDIGGAWNDYRLEWARIVARYRGHLALLEPWDEARREVLPTLAASCVIRDADMKPPLPALRSAGTSHDEALEGGALWGVESGAVYKAILRNPASTSATIADAGFSALGGYGFQKASFDNDLSSVYANVSMGRAYDYTVERIGRIGVFWNRAKHVIVYQRAVVPSQQFRHLTPLLGRPVLRKVAEYVEILEPERKYPEFGEAPATRGFVTACSFSAGTRIPVDSAWGQDIGDEGWQIPLYNPAEAARNPAAYPKPQIFLYTRSERDGKPVDLPALMTAPEQLVFYTQTTPGTPADTNAWPPVLGVDFIAASVEVAEGGRAENLASPVPDPTGPAARISRFSFQVDVPEAVNLVAERTDVALRAVVETVTMMRRPIDIDAARLRTAIPEATSAVAQAGELSTQLGDVWEQLSARLAGRVAIETSNVLPGGVVEAELEAWGKDAKAMVDAAKRELATREAALIADVEAMGKSVDAYANRAMARLRQPAGDRANQFTVFWSRVGEELLELHAQAVSEGWWTDLARRDAALATFFEHGVRDEFARLGGTPDPLRRLVSLAAGAARRLAAAEATIQQASDALGAATTVTAARAAVAQLRNRLDDAVADAERMLRKLQGPDLPAPAMPLDALLQPVRGALLPLDQAIAAAGAVGASSLPQAAWNDARGAAMAAIEALLAEVRAIAGNGAPTTPVGRLLKDFGGDAVAAQLGGIWNTKVLVGDIEANARELVAGTKIGLELDALEERVRKQAVEIGTQLWGSGRTAIGKALTEQTLRAQVQAAGMAAAIVAGLRVPDGLPRAIASVKSLRDVQQIGRAELDRHIAAAEERVEGAVRQLIRDQVIDSDKTLRLLHAYGVPPELPNLAFDRKRVEYAFKGIADSVRMTPSIAAVSALRGHLDSLNGVNPLGMRVPTRELLNRCIPEPLQNFKLSEVFRDFAGLPLRGMFAGVKLPKIASDRVIVQHGTDPERQRAWVEAEVQPFQFAPGTLFAIGPLAVTLPSAEFSARMRADIALSGETRRSSEAKIRGDWRLILAGQQLLTIRDTTVEFLPSGKLRFDLDPRNIELSGAMAFISDLLNDLAPEGSGLTISVLPNGVQSLLELPLPDLSGGSFSIANLRLGAKFALTFEKDGLAVTAGVTLATKEAPFTLTIFVLGGSGFIDVSARYVIGGKIRCHAEVGISAAARIGISLGPISGAVAIYLGIAISYQQGERGASGVHFAMNLLISGHVSILGIVSATVSLLLELIYGSGSLIGRGTFSIKIKICRFYTLRVRRAVTYRLACDALAAGGHAPARLPITRPEVEALADTYVMMLA